MNPECELELELKYRECLKCKDRCKVGKSIIDSWENHTVEEYHRKIKEDGLLDTRGM